MASPEYDKFMAFVDALAVSNANKAIIKAAGDALHTGAVREETQNVVRNLLIIQAEQDAAGAPAEVQLATTIALDACAKIETESGGMIVDRYRDAVAEYKATR